MLLGWRAKGHDQCNHSQNDKKHRGEHNQHRIFRWRRLFRRIRLLSRVVKLLGTGSARTVLAENLLLKH
jgi:hypothetical protein